MEDNSRERRQGRRHQSNKAFDGIKNGMNAAGSGSNRGKGNKNDNGFRKYIIKTILLIMVCTMAMFMVIFAVYIRTCIIPNADIGVDALTSNQSSIIYYQDADGESWQELESLHGGENRIWSDYDSLPKYLEHAAVAVEDKRFYKHHGVDWSRTASATVNMFISMKNNYGGSTLTQQTIKNLTGDKEGTVKRKVLEIFRALKFEKSHSKEEIIELYLNNIYLGENCYGVTTAAQAYFGKDVGELSLAECACLIGITNNPSLFDPYISDATKQRNKDRQEIILQQMLKQGYITQEEYDQAMSEKLVFTSGKSDSTSDVYSYFVDQVISDVIDGLMEEKNVTSQVAAQMVYYGGLKIYATIDPAVQACVDSVYNEAANLDYHSKKGQQMQSAITVIDPKTGNIVAIAGGVGEKKASRVLNRATSLRQCGSAIKPIAVYAPALDAGVITPASVIDDSPVRMLNNSPWPKNSHPYYDGLTTIDYAVSQSINTIAVRVVEMLGTQKSYDFMKNKLGFTTLQATGSSNDLNSASMGLGGLTNGVNTVEMAAAYAAFSNDGVYNTPRTYSLVTDANDKTILDNASESQVAMKETTAYFINNYLKQVISSGTGGSAAFSGMTIAGKTGTTTDNKDRYFVGYSPYYSAAVWTGYDQPEKINVSGNPSAVLWRKVMSKIHEDLPNKGFDKPESGLTTVSVCKDSGLLATDECANDVRGSRVRSVSVVTGTEPTTYCTMHKTVEWCEEGKALATENCPKESVKYKTVLDYVRDSVGGVSCTDTPYLLSTVEKQGACTVHNYTPPVEENPDGETGGDTTGEIPGDGTDTGETEGETGTETPKPETPTTEHTPATR